MSAVLSIGAASICGTLLLAACSSDEEAPDRGAVPEPSSSATPLAEQPEGSALPPGRYAVPFVGLDQETAWAEVEIHRGFESYNGSFLWHGSDEDPSYALSFWRITGVNPDPCRSDEPAYQDPGPTLRDLATSLQGQPHRYGGGPEPVELAGYEGLYLQLNLSKRFDPARCETGSYEAWQAVDPEYSATYDRYQYGPGFVDRIWILDVAGERLVVNAAFDSRIGDKDMAALEAMVDSITIGVESAE